MFPEAFLDRILCPFPYVNLHYRDGNKFCLLCLALPWMGKEIIWGQLNRAGQRDCHFPLAAPQWFFSYKGSAQASLVESLCSFLPLPRIGLVHCFIKIKRISFCQLVQKTLSGLYRGEAAFVKCEVLFEWTPCNGQFIWGVLPMSVSEKSKLLVISSD